MCCRNSPPGQDLELHRRASCRAHRAATRGGLRRTWKQRKLTWWAEKKTKTHTRNSAHESRSQLKASSPLKQLPDDQEAECYGQSRSQVLQFGEHFPVVVRQVGPAVALGEPDPVGPQPFAQSRQHPAGRQKRKREVFNRFIFKLIQGQTKEMNAY